MNEATRIVRQMDCDHEWVQCATPPDAFRPWFRCRHCKVFGYRKRTGSGRYIYYAYTCQKPLCKRPAIERLAGRGSRASYLWRCKECLDEEATRSGDT